MTDSFFARELYQQALYKQWGESPDLDAAIPIYRLSADLGFAGAQNNLGDCYERGVGVPQSDVISMYWYTRAAERGEPTAYLGLASVLLKNFGDEAVLIEALKYAILAKALLPDGGNKDLARLQEGLIVAKLSPHGIEKAVELAQAWEPLTQEEYLQEDSPAFSPLPATSEDTVSDPVETVSQSQHSFDALWGYCQMNGRAIPRDWHSFYRKLLLKRSDEPRGGEPPLPLILAAWHETTPLQKHLRFREQVEWARDQGQIERVGRYLRSYDESDWLHFNEL